jgi:hypothetical protein
MDVTGPLLPHQNATKLCSWTIIAIIELLQGRQGSQLLKVHPLIGVFGSILWLSVCHLTPLLQQLWDFFEQEAHQDSQNTSLDCDEAAVAAVTAAAAAAAADCDDNASLINDAIVQTDEHSLDHHRHERHRQSHALSSSRTAFPLPDARHPIVVNVKCNDVPARGKPETSTNFPRLTRTSNNIDKYNHLVLLDFLPHAPFSTLLSIILKYRI